MSQPALSLGDLTRMRVRAIAPDELHTFATFNSGPDYTFAPSRPAAFEAWLRRYWDTRNSCPEWCFVAERDGRYVGSVVYEGEVGGRSVHVEHVRLPWRGGYLPLGRHLLRESLRLLDTRPARPRRALASGCSGSNSGHGISASSPAGRSTVSSASAASR